MNFKLLVFDWDGTLMDSEQRIVDCVQAAAKDLSLPVPSSRQASNIIGLGLKEAVTSLFPEGDDQLVHQMVVAYRKHFLSDNQAPSHLFPRAAETVRELEKQGYLLAVATGKGRKGLDNVLDTTGMHSLFHYTRCADESLSKPHPEMLQQIMDVLDTEPEDTLMIGDTEYDMEMATNARAHKLAVSYGVHAPKRLMRHEPLGCLDEIGGLLDWLKQIDDTVS